MSDSTAVVIPREAQRRGILIALQRSRAKSKFVDYQDFSLSFEMTVGRCLLFTPYQDSEFGSK